VTLGARRIEEGDRESGAILVLTTLLLTSILAVTALVLDLGALRGNARVDQSVADFAALSAGSQLGRNNPTAACQAAANYINANVQLSSPINATTFCSGMATTSCATGGSGQATPSTSSGNYTISVHYPVPDSEILDSNIAGGLRLNDGTACSRMRVLIGSTQQSIFAGVLGTSTLSAIRSATVRPWSVGPNKTPALWMLDPTGCTALGVTGGSKVTVGTDAVPGVLSIDSDGSTCSSNQHTISASGSGTQLWAWPTSGSSKGTIQLRALQPAATTCSGTACDPADVSSGRLLPQPVGVSARATRARVDDVYNCKDSYPNYHGLTLSSLCKASPNPPPSPYIDDLIAAIGTSGAPSGAPTGLNYQRWTSSYSCNAPSGLPPLAGNWWVDCPGGLTVGNGSTVNFTSGNVIFDGGFSLTNGGTIGFNTNNQNSLPSNCATSVCIFNSSPAASLVYVRAGDISVNGGTSTLTVNHAMVYTKTGAVSVNGAPPNWVAPTEGPFTYLALWSDMPSTSNQTGQFALAGGTSPTLGGVFFTPEAAPFSLSGGGVWNQQNAQFISYRLAVSGGGTLFMSPDPDKAVKTPTLAGTLIR